MQGRDGEHEGSYSVTTRRHGTVRGCTTGLWKVGTPAQQSWPLEVGVSPSSWARV